jgi:nucleotide-binding universal stress UspA family protein
MKILFATDGSESAHAAGALLAALPLPPETELRVITVLPDRPMWSEVFAGHLAGRTDLIEEMEAGERRRAGCRLAQAAAPFCKRDISVQSLIRSGHPGDEILRAGEELPADLISVGAHGRTGWGPLVGSTAEHVAKRAKGPVLVVRPSTRSIERIVLATDGSEHSQAAVDRLRDLPFPRTASVTVLHVAESFFASPGLAPAMREEFEQTVRDIRRAQLKNADLLVEATRRLVEAAGYDRTTASVRSGHPAQGILAAAGEANADLIVVGARGVSPVREFLLGSVSGRILRYAPCSVLVARG